MGDSDNNGGYVGFGGNVSGTLKSPDTKARLRNAINRFSIPAPALSWGRWQEVFAQAGVTGPDTDRHVTRITVST